MKPVDIQFADPNPALLGEEILMHVRDVHPAAVLRSGVADRCRHAKSADHFSVVFGALVEGGWLEAEIRVGERTVYKLGPKADKPLPRMPEITSGAKPGKPASALHGLEAPALTQRAFSGVCDEALGLLREQESPLLPAKVAARLHVSLTVAEMALQKLMDGGKAVCTPTGWRAVPLTTATAVAPKPAAKPAVPPPPAEPNPFAPTATLATGERVAKSFLEQMATWTEPGQVGDLIKVAETNITTGRIVMYVLEERAQVVRSGPPARSRWALPQSAQLQPAATEEAAVAAAPDAQATEAAPPAAAAAPEAAGEWKPEDLQPGQIVRALPGPEGKTRGAIEQLLKGATAPLSAASIGYAVGVQQTATLYHLRELEREGRAVREGAGKAVRWSATGQERGTEAPAPKAGDIEDAEFAMWSDGRLEIRAAGLGGAITFSKPASKALIDYLDRTYRLHLHPVAAP